jgi:hypothetical protein
VLFLVRSRELDLLSVLDVSSTRYKTHHRVALPDHNVIGRLDCVNMSGKEIGHLESACSIWDPPCRLRIDR